MKRKRCDEKGIRMGTHNGNKAVELFRLSLASYYNIPRTCNDIPDLTNDIRNTAKLGWYEDLRGTSHTLELELPNLVCGNTLYNTRAPMSSPTFSLQKACIQESPGLEALCRKCWRSASNGARSRPGWNTRCQARGNQRQLSPPSRTSRFLSIPIRSKEIYRLPRSAIVKRACIGFVDFVTKMEVCLKIEVLAISRWQKVYYIVRSYDILG